ncbi:unnamed protein product [Rhizoctonia solani]|uniref:Uncharacterized protein n=1 Tax=Rhizoctonia solani TaxID=456999 RepID=A0A8H3DDE0_9AGAM|nr:unnamed protein product [Rhizoctonia solani]
MASLSSPISTHAPSGSRKRKSGTNSAPAPKKPRGRKVKVDPYATAKGYIDAILGPPDSFSLPESPQDILEMLKTVAEYAKNLEGSVAVASCTGQDAPPPKTAEQLAADVERLQTIINRGVTKQMSWKPSCRDGGARFAFDGLCADPRVFGALFRLGGPPKWKAKKFNRDEFEEFVGDVQGHARYSTLKLMSDVNIRYNPETGEFKVSGTYGDRDAWEARMRAAARAAAITHSPPRPHPMG